ncbi:MAG: hypothetical protein PHW52_00590 [Candidatus Pacebacteria bacterium]|nr:hypothetical protein [Candidatus Paceibacterota bacterium]
MANYETNNNAGENRIAGKIPENDGNDIEREEVFEFLERYSVPIEEISSIIDKGRNDESIKEFLNSNNDFKTSKGSLKKIIAEETASEEKIGSEKKIPSELDAIYRKALQEIRGQEDQLTSDEGIPTPTENDGQETIIGTPTQEETLVFNTSEGPLEYAQTTEGIPTPTKINEKETIIDTPTENITTDEISLENQVPAPDKQETPAPKTEVESSIEPPLSRIYIKKIDVNKVEELPTKSSEIKIKIPSPKKDWEEKDELFERTDLPHIEDISEDNLYKMTNEALEKSSEKRGNTIPTPPEKTWKEKDEFFERPNLAGTKNESKKNQAIKDEKESKDDQELELLQSLNEKRILSCKELREAEADFDKDPTIENQERIDEAVKGYEAAYSSYGKNLNRLASELKTTPSALHKENLVRQEKKTQEDLNKSTEKTLPQEEGEKTESIEKKEGIIESEGEKTEPGIEHIEPEKVTNPKPIGIRWEEISEPPLPEQPINTKEEEKKTAPEIKPIIMKEKSGPEVKIINIEPKIIEEEKAEEPEETVETKRTYLNIGYEKKKDSITFFIGLKKKEIEEKKESLGKNKKELFNKLINIAKDKRTQAIIGAALIGLSVAIPPVGGAALLTGGAISGFLPVELGMATKVIGGAAGGFLIRKMIEKANKDKENSEKKSSDETKDIKKDGKGSEEESVPAPENKKIETIPEQKKDDKKKTPETIITENKKNEKAPEKTMKTEEKGSEEEGIPVPENKKIETIPEQKKDDKEKEIVTPKEVIENNVNLRINKNLENIKENIDKQPISVQKMFPEMKDKFESSITVDGKEFMFANISKNKVMALVKDSENSGKWKTRFFRYSESDHQWKVLPGKKPSGIDSKGEESNELHHYVQSAKIDKNIYKEIEKLSKKNNYDFEKYIPKEKDLKNSGGQFEDELEFKENHLELKNPVWKEFQKNLQGSFRAYNSLIIDNSAKWTDNYNFIENYSSKADDFKKLKEAIDIARNEKEYIESLKKPDTGNINKFQALEQSNNPKLKKIPELYEEAIGKLFERTFSFSLPEGMTPDFSKKPVDSYSKGNILIEEYAVKNEAGDNLVFAMAKDGQGRVYIDDIYDPRVGTNDYGGHDKICQMGHLVFKPEDYTTQTFGIPKKYKKPILDKDGKRTAYTDINDFWGNIPIIKQYKEELEKRDNKKA